jgi:hypothetical protein
MWSFKMLPYIYLKRGCMSFQLINIGIADLKVTTTPNVLRTILGSCVGICLYDPGTKVIGLSHIMLAEQNIAVDRKSMWFALLMMRRWTIGHETRIRQSTGPACSICQLIMGNRKSNVARWKNMGSISIAMSRDIGCDSDYIDFFG